MEDAGQCYFVVGSEVVWTELWTPAYGGSLLLSSLGQKEAVNSQDTYILVY
jgi:hypothetical protein